MRQRPCTVHAGDGCEVGYCEGEVSIALVLVLDVIPLAVIRAVACAYGKWLRVGCLIGWPRLSRCIRGTCGFSSIYIFKSGAVFLKGGAVVQSSRIFALFAAYIGLPVSGTSFTVGWQYLSVSYAIYPHNTTQLQLRMCYGR